jgi:hypothetical protein
MSDPQIDPAGNTQQFKAFAQRREPEAAPSKPSYLVPVIVGVAVVIVVAVIAFLLVK